MGARRNVLDGSIGLLALTANSSHLIGAVLRGSGPVGCQLRVGVQVALLLEVLECLGACVCEVHFLGGCKGLLRLIHDHGRV